MPQSLKNLFGARKTGRADGRDDGHRELHAAHVPRWPALFRIGTVEPAATSGFFSDGGAAAGE